ncbi:MAG: hypothetical protein WAN35_10195 [Terracidiphilus sp.]
MDRKDISKIMVLLLNCEGIEVENANTLRAALQTLCKAGRISRLLIAASARAAGCCKIVTFDRITACNTGMELL